MCAHTNSHMHACLLHAPCLFRCCFLQLLTFLTARHPPSTPSASDFHHCHHQLLELLTFLTARSHPTNPHYHLVHRPASQVASTTKGMDLPSLLCIMQHCRQQVMDCVNDPVCKAGLDCLETCSFNDQVGIGRGHREGEGEGRGGQNMAQSAGCRVKLGTECGGVGMKRGCGEAWVVQ